MAIITFVRFLELISVNMELERLIIYFASSFILNFTRPYETKYIFMSFSEPY